MRVLVVDQDSSSNEAIARSLRELFTVDAVTNKADCLDLLRSNTFEVIVATERLEDGSGLELLGQIAKKWPAVLRIFAADRERLALLKGRLGPFELFQTLTYPIDADRLITALNLAEAAQEADADTSNIRHVVLTSETTSEDIEHIDFSDSEPSASTSESTVESTSESGQFPAPQPLPRVAGAGRSQRAAPAPRGGGRVAPHRARSTHGTRGGGTSSHGHTSHGHSSHGVRSHEALGQPVTRLGSGTLRRAGSGSSGRAGAGRTGRPQPPRVPPLERSPPLDRSREAEGLDEAAAMARAARSSFELPAADEFDSKRLAIRVGAGAVALLVVVVLGFKLFGSSNTVTPQPVAAVVKAPQVSPLPPAAERSVAPKASGANSSGSRSAGKRNKARRNEAVGAENSGGAGASPAAAGTGSAALVANDSAREHTPSSSATAASSETAATTTSPSTPGSVATATSGPGHADGPAFPPETPPGITRVSATSTAGTPAAATATATNTPAAPASTAEAGSTEASPTQEARPPPASTRRPSSSEPPPVIREAKLIRRVEPDYPSAARREATVGFVDLEVTVSPNGEVKNVSVVRANPQDVFDKSALAAVRKWKYDPRYVDGLPAEAHLKVHLEFAPGGG